MATLDLGLEADELLRAAQDGAYRLPPGFPGFTAALRLHDGRTESDGTVTVPAGSAPELSIDADDDAISWASHELGSMAMHRRHRTYEEGDGRHDKRVADDDGHALGRLVELEDAMRSTFRVRDRQIEEISRSHGGSRFTIVIQERASGPDGRSVSSAFTVYFWDEESGRLTRSDAYADTHVVVDGVLLPAARQVATADDDGLRVRRFELSGHALLPGDRS